MMKDPDFIKKWEDGPSGFLIIRPSGKNSMGTNMALSFGFNVFVSAVVGYLATIGLGFGADAMDVFRLIAPATFIACWGAHVPNAIWFSFTWSSTFKHALDALMYAVATGLIFTSLWPDVALPL